MKREEIFQRAKEVGEFIANTSPSTYNAALRGFCRGAKFANKTMLDRACEWLAKHISPEEIYETDETPTTYLTVNLHDNMLDFINAFRQAMEGGTK